VLLSRIAFCLRLSCDVTSVRGNICIQLMFLETDTDVSDERVSFILILIVVAGDNRFLRNVVIRLPVYTVSQTKDYNVEKP
jgi:hypothetical protein